MTTATRAILPTLALLACAAIARAQEEQDQFVMNDGKTQTAKIISEDVGGVTYALGGGSGNTATMRWGTFKDMILRGSPEFTKAKTYVDANNWTDAVPVLKGLVADTKLRSIQKTLAMYWLGLMYEHAGQLDEAVAADKSFLEQNPKSHYAQPAAWNFVNVCLAKGALDEAAKTVDTLKGEPVSLALLKGRVNEAKGAWGDALSAYKAAEDGASDPALKATARIGRANCLFHTGKASDAMSIYDELKVKDDLPPLVVAGAWNGIGDVYLADGMQKKGAEGMEKALDAMYCYLRASVLYAPSPSDPTSECERGIAGTAVCFKVLWELEQDKNRKAKWKQWQQERMAYLKNKYPNSRYHSE